MADSIAFAIYDGAGVPLTGATPTFVKYCDAATAVNFTQPTITEVGTALYQFTPSDADETARTAYLIDTGAGNLPRYIAGNINNTTNPFEAFLVTKDDGTLADDLDPVITIYCKPDGTALTAPIFNLINNGLYTLIPAPADYGTDAHFFIVNQRQGPIDGNPKYYSGSIEKPGTGGGGGGGSPSVPAYAYALSGGPGVFLPTTQQGTGRALSVGRDLELDPLTQDLKLTTGDLTLVRELAAIRQEVDIRLKFFLGEWFLDLTAGLPYFQSILVKAPNLAAIETVLRNEILATTGVKSIQSLTLDFDRAARTLRVRWSANTDLNELINSVVDFEA